MEAMISVIAIKHQKKHFGSLLRWLVLPICIMYCLSLRVHAANPAEKLILGNWKCTEVIPNKLHNINKDGFTFYKDSICDYMPGYVSKETSADSWNDHKKFLGTKTKYRLLGNQLGIFNKSKNDWQSFRIKSISEKKMALVSDEGIEYVFSRIKNIKVEDVSYDQIILSASGCFGSCPSNMISVKESGEVVYCGIKYNSKNGLYSARVDKKNFKEIKNTFSRTPVSTLKEEYIMPVKDTEEITVTFIKDGKIVKTIRDNYRLVPHEFYWAYSSLRYLYQNLKTDTISSRFSLYPFTSMLIESTNKRFLLRGSEAFYLWLMLMNKPETNQSFMEVYQIQNMGKDEIKTMTSDGRFFKIVDRDGRSKTYDLGYDFFTHNQLLSKFFPR
jgi:hypothetical protein